MTDEGTQMAVALPAAKTFSDFEKKKSISFKNALRLQESFTSAAERKALAWLAMRLGPYPGHIFSCAQLVWRQPGRNAGTPSQQAAAPLRFLRRSHDRYLWRAISDGWHGALGLYRLENRAGHVRGLSDALRSSVSGNLYRRHISTFVREIWANRNPDFTGSGKCGPVVSSRRANPRLVLPRVRRGRNRGHCGDGSDAGGFHGVQYAETVSRRAAALMVELRDFALEILANSNEAQSMIKKCSDSFCAALS